MSPVPDRPSLLLALAIGLGVGVVAWMIGEAVREAFAPRKVAVTLRGVFNTNAPTSLTTANADIKNVALSTGLFGALLGGALGVAGGYARRPAGASPRAALIGLAAGGAAGAGVAMVLTTAYYRQFLRFTPEDLIQPLLIHAGIWGTIGAAGGLAFGLGTGTRDRAVRALIGGLLGAVIAAVIYEFVGAVMFPESKTFQPSAADWRPRLMARLLVAVLASLGAALAVADRERQTRAA